jgi:LmbE family N-acetylglucosaminyl deacetylase
VTGAGEGEVRALVVTAHPDDETICVGGVIALLARRGVKVTICCSTRGEGGVTGEPPICLPGELGARREGELRQAAAVLGAVRVMFLGYVDPAVGPGNALRAASDDLEEFAGQVLWTLRRERPQLVVTHGSDGEYGHPQHVATHRAVRLAWQRWDDAGRGSLYSFAPATGPGQYFGVFRNASDEATAMVDISSVLAVKERAFACHASQVATTLRDAGLAQVEGMFPPWEGLRRWSGGPALEELLGAAVTVPVTAAGNSRGSRGV